MNAAVSGLHYNLDESELMPVNEKEDLPLQVAKLRSDVEHIQSDVSDIKIDLRATNQRIDALSDKMDRRFDAFEQKMDQRFEAAERKFDQKMDQRFGVVDARFSAVDARFSAIEARFDKVDERFEKVDQRVTDVLISLASWKVWAIGLYTALAGGMFLVAAKGFHWL